jgi:A/G-specific adenine glycosylase
MGEDVDADPAWVERVRRDLAAWYDSGHRDLPWRRGRDPYEILVSETMLVQTTVAAVVPYFERFLARFPTVEALARAEEADVLKAWEGLGYYRRARQLLGAARAIVERHGGAIPDDPEALLALPGVGRYIAGAVLSFAFDRPAAIVEANTQRVLARWLAWPGEIRATSTQKRLWLAAGRLVPSEGAGRFNQAIMELGATVCSPKSPICLVCPVSGDCRARALGLQDILPKKSAKAAPLEVVEECAIVARGGAFLMVKRASGGLWEGFWEFPTVLVSGVDPAGRSFGEAIDLDEGLFRLTGVRARIEPASKVVRFGVTKHRVTLSARLATWIGGEPTPGRGLVEARWVDREDLPGLTLGSAMRRVATWADRESGAIDSSGEGGEDGR